MKHPEEMPPPLRELPTVREAIQWVRGLVQTIGLGFHPDTAFSDYARPDGTPSFTKQQCDELERNLTRAWNCLETHGIDIYRVGLALTRRMMTAGMDFSH